MGIYVIDSVYSKISGSYHSRYFLNVQNYLCPIVEFLKISDTRYILANILGMFPVA